MKDLEFNGSSKYGEFIVRYLPYLENTCGIVISFLVAMVLEQEN
jgi:hypothetical protein